MFISVFLFLLLVPSAALAHGNLWAMQFSNWTDGIQWNVIFGVFVGGIAAYGSVKFLFRRIANIDLLDYAGLRRFVKSPYYPAVFQISALIVFIIIAWFLFTGSPQFSENPGAPLVWTLWWALLPISFLLVGRLWCAVCPFAWISDLVQKYLGQNRRVPVWLPKYSFWIVDGIFLFITWFDRVYGMTTRPLMTGLVFLGLTIGVVICAVLYERRVFCRYVCFLGNVAGTYAMAAPIELVSKDPEVCRRCPEKFCFAGRAGKSGCPFYQVMPVKEGNRFCTLCAQCVKVCPHDNIALRFRPFGADFWHRAYVRFEESFFAKMLVGIVILQNIGMLTLWDSFSRWVSRVTGITDSRLLFTAVYLLVISLPLLLMFGMSFFSARFSREKTVQNFARFGYAFVAVDLAGHIAHNLNHFFGEGKTILAAAIGIFSGKMQQMIFQWFLNFGTVRVMQYGVLGLGMIATFIITYRIAGKTATSRAQMAAIMMPHLLLLAALMIFNFYIFSQPMMHRSENIL